MSNWMMQGSHRYYAEAELIFFELHGLFSLEDMQKVNLLSQASAKEFGYVVSVFDARDGLNMSPAARRCAAEMSRDFPISGASLIIGASLTIRTVALLILNATRLFGKTTTPVDFCSTLEEVPQWLEHQRQRLRAAHAAKVDSLDKS
jgi:energy-coupling factor transporter transmembrane protein EcfT